MNKNEMGIYRAEEIEKEGGQLRNVATFDLISVQVSRHDSSE